MNMQRRIITFGLTEAQNALVEQSRPAGNYEVFDTDAPTDVIAIGAVAIIVFAPTMDEDSIGMIFDYYTEVEGCTNDTVIWLGEPKPPKSLRVQRKAGEWSENSGNDPPTSRHHNTEAG